MRGRKGLYRAAGILCPCRVRCKGRPRGQGSRFSREISGYKVRCHDPAADTRYHLELGEISSYPPGYKENGAIFCHNNPWVSIAETVCGHGARAFEIYKKTCPAYIEDISEIHRTEPYVYSQMVAGKDAKFFGEGKNSWLTGTAAWTFVDISQYILGVMPTHEIPVYRRISVISILHASSAVSPIISMCRILRMWKKASGALQWTASLCMAASFHLIRRRKMCGWMLF